MHQGTVTSSLQPIAGVAPGRAVPLVRGAELGVPEGLVMEPDQARVVLHAQPPECHPPTTGSHFRCAANGCVAWVLQVVSEVMVRRLGVGTDSGHPAPFDLVLHACGTQCTAEPSNNMSAAR